jgi:hypothetical protein
VKRTQIYLDDAQDRLLAELAATRATTKSDLIRTAIDRYLERDVPSADEAASRWRSALDATFGAAPYLEPGATFVADLRRVDAARSARR